MDPEVLEPWMLYREHRVDLVVLLALVDLSLPLSLSDLVVPLGLERLVGLADPVLVKYF